MPKQNYFCINKGKSLFKKIISCKKERQERWRVESKAGISFFIHTFEETGCFEKKKIIRIVLNKPLGNVLVGVAPKASFFNT